MAQVISRNVQKGDDALSVLLKGLSIARDVYGIRADSAKLDEYKQKQESEANVAKGKYNKNQQVELGKTFDVLGTKPTAGNFQEASDLDTGTPLYIVSKKEQTPLFESVQTIKNGKPGTGIIYKKILAQTGDVDKAMVGFYEGKPTEEKQPIKIDTVDSNGNQITEFVKPVAGKSYPTAPKNSNRGPTSQTAQEIGSFDAAFKMIDNLEEKYKSQASRPGSFIGSFIPGTDSNLYEKNRDVAAQTLGVILEKGKLTDRDYERYVNMLPKTSDRNNVAAEKFDAFRKFILEKKQGEISGLQQSGFDTSGYQNTSPDALAIDKNVPEGTAIASPSKISFPPEPKIGTIEDGHRYNGGGAGNPKNWSKVGK